MAEKFGKTWWGQKWLQSLNNIDYSNRLALGSSYARKGYVTHIDIQGNHIDSSVQGSRITPYKVQLKLPAFSGIQQNPANKIFILSLKAAGTGLNLTAANHVIHYDLWWNPAVEAQATDRAYRIGQKKNVMVHRLITKNTFEERINAMITSKKALAEMTVSTGENWIGNLSNKELKALFTLS
ncbi:MAG TPA: helicase-related protein [Sphingobacteriaceae bacterium]|nr:helicase-related protein [Sphingobacteriaceae bacterium]